MKKYRKKPVVVEAEQFLPDGSNAKLLARYSSVFLDIDGTLKVRTLEGIHIGTPGDYLIKGIKGEMYFCKPEIFEQTYELIKE